MPATKVSNSRDLLVQLLGELLFVERRLADSVIQELASAAKSEELREALEQHRTETTQHAVRVEVAFRQIGVAPTSNLCRPFESAVAQHDDLQRAIVGPKLADFFHAQAALQTEHWEIASYTAILALANSMGLDGELGGLRTSLMEEEQARNLLAELVERLGRAASTS
jgi:ferritin-like metal-binding protein YciE